MSNLIEFVIGSLIMYSLGALSAYLYVRKELRRIMKDSERNAEEYIDALKEVHEYREKQLFFEDMNQRILEMFADYLDDEDFQIDKEIVGLEDPIVREESELHIRMAKAAVEEVKKTFIDKKKSSIDVK